MYSKSTQRILKQYNLTPQELTFCLVYLAGYTTADSYMMAVQPMSNKAGTIIKAAKRMSEQTNVRSFITEMNGTIGTINQQQNEHPEEKIEEIDIEDIMGGTNLDKGKMVKTLASLVEQAKDPKLKAELIMKLADLSGVRKEQIETDDNKIYYYLPITCNVCPKNQ